MEINYTLYFFAFFEKVIKKTIDILLLEKRLFLAELHLPQSDSKKEFCWKPQANGPTWSGLIFFYSFTVVDTCTRTSTII